jgi:hypothetical protein
MASIMEGEVETHTDTAAAVVVIALNSEGLYTYRF